MQEDTRDHLIGWIRELAITSVFDTQSGKVNLKMSKLRKLPFESAIIERYQRRECSVNENGYRDVLGAHEGAKEDLESWKSLFRRLKERALRGVKLIISDKCLGFS